VPDDLLGRDDTAKYKTASAEICGEPSCKGSIESRHPSSAKSKIKNLQDMNNKNVTVSPTYVSDAQRKPAYFIHEPEGVFGEELIGPFDDLPSLEDYVRLKAEEIFSELIEVEKLECSDVSLLQKVSENWLPRMKVLWFVDDIRARLTPNRSTIFVRGHAIS